jgi:hypothetical protein
MEAVRFDLSALTIIASLRTWKQFSRPRHLTFSAPLPNRALKKACGTKDAQMLSTPWIRKLAAFLQLLSLLGEMRVRAQAVETRFSTAC